MEGKVEFDYAAAVEELESIAAKVENPQTSISEIERYVSRSEMLIGQCRDYLRGVRGKLEELEEK